jgi:hypothetical protein
VVEFRHRKSFDIDAAAAVSEITCIEEALFYRTSAIIFWPLYPDEWAAMFDNCFLDFDVAEYPAPGCSLAGARATAVTFPVPQNGRHCASCL